MSTFRNMKSSTHIVLILVIGFVILSIIYIGYGGNPYFSTVRINIEKYFPSRTLSYGLNILGSYGVIQVLAQDLGIKSGLKQIEITHNEFSQFILYWGMAFALTDNRTESLAGVLLYFYLKYIVSKNETGNACFLSDEDEKNNITYIKQKLDELSATKSKS
jgi:hypothetical protein